MSKKAARKIDIGEMSLATGDELDPEVYPELTNLSAGFLFQFVPCPKEKLPPEFVYLSWPKGNRDENRAELEVAVASWNTLWEAGQLRPEVIELPETLSWLRDLPKANVYLLPKKPFHRYEVFAPLFHLLPQHTLKAFGLPLLKRGMWPFIMNDYSREQAIPQDFDRRLSHAFAHHIWPLIDPRSKMRAFSAKSEPLVLLAHNLDFWVPHAYSVAEERLRTFPRSEIENEEQGKLLADLRVRYSPHIDAERPRMGGTLWMGEDEAWEATKDIIDAADRGGKLRALIEAVRSNRIADDFSDRWSFERADFERKLYNRRSKIRVSFVELDDTIPVHGTESEIHEELLWEDFMALLNVKEKSITVCLRNGVTKLAEISNILGYANHSPVSKALKIIREKAKAYFEN